MGGITAVLNNRAKNNRVSPYYLSGFFAALFQFHFPPKRSFQLGVESMWHKGTKHSAERSAKAFRKYYTWLANFFNVRFENFL